MNSLLILTAHCMFHSPNSLSITRVDIKKTAVANSRLFTDIKAESKLKIWWNKAGDFIKIRATDTMVDNKPTSARSFPMQIQPAYANQTRTSLRKSSIGKDSREVSVQKVPIVKKKDITKC